MTLKHRRIHLFLQIFFLLTGLYEGLHSIQLIMQPDLANNLFIPQNAQLPIITLAIHLLAMILSIFSGIALWSRAVWAYGVSLFTSGILFALNLFNLSAAIEENSFHIIPIIFILLVLMQSFPFLLRRAYRGA
ncbi:MAG: hypothetical protein U5K71_03740 [Gracilimonas sp.]|nr:hypothetical protein [Gracilimonas sp.]